VNDPWNVNKLTLKNNFRVNTVFTKDVYCSKSFPALKCPVSNYEGRKFRHDELEVVKE
jgi:hypothetical protein